MISLAGNSIVVTMEGSAEVSELNKEAAVNSGNKVYEVGGARINLGWEKFTPKEPTVASSDEAVIVLPGWGAKINTKPVDALGGDFANNSHLPTYAVIAEAEQVHTVEDSLYKEAKAVLQFLQEKGIKKVTLTGYSQDSSRAINLAVLMQEWQKIDPAVEVNGLVLMEPTGLYEQDSGKMGKKFAYDSLVGTSAGMIKDVGKYAVRKMWAKRKPIGKAFAESWRVNQVPRTLDVGRATLFGMLKDWKDLINPRSVYWQRAGAQAKEMAKQNPRTSQVRCPVIIVVGAQDTVIDHNQIVPSSVEEKVARRRQEVKDSKQAGAQTWKQKWARFVPSEDIREKFFRENVFTSSPYVRMIVPEKAAFHGLPLFRDVARASLGLLDRARRELRVNQPQKTAP